MKAQSNDPGGAGTAARVACRTVNVDGLDIFYREAGPKDATAVLPLPEEPGVSPARHRTLRA